jgi:hypothetical protein
MLGRNFRELLIGAGAPPDERERLRAVLCRHGEVHEVVDLRTMYVGPRALLVAARIDLEPGIVPSESRSCRRSSTASCAMPSTTSAWCSSTRLPAKTAAERLARTVRGSGPGIDTKEGSYMASEEQQNEQQQNDEQQDEQDESQGQEEQGGGGSTVRAAAMGAAAGAAVGAAAGAATSQLRGGGDRESGRQDEEQEQNEESSEAEGDAEGS